MSSKVQRKDRKYKDLSMKQKTRIAEKSYRAYLTFYLEYGLIRLCHLIKINHRSRPLLQSVHSLENLFSLTMNIHTDLKTEVAKIHGNNIQLLL